MWSIILAIILFIIGGIIGFLFWRNEEDKRYALEHLNDEEWWKKSWDNSSRDIRDKDK